MADPSSRVSSSPSTPQITVRCALSCVTSRVAGGEAVEARISGQSLSSLWLSHRAHRAAVPPRSLPPPNFPARAWVARLVALLHHHHHHHHHTAVIVTITQSTPPSVLVHTRNGLIALFPALSFVFFQRLLSKPGVAVSFLLFTVWLSTTVEGSPEVCIINHAP